MKRQVNVVGRAIVTTDEIDVRVKIGGFFGKWVVLHAAAPVPKDGWSCTDF